MTLHVGFTGTRTGMTLAQQASVTLLLLELGATDLHHGDCVGADDQADQIGRELGLTIHLHPPTDRTKRAFNVIEVEIYPEKPYLERNRDIVDATALMVATPAGTDRRRSGTWYTVLYAMKRDKPVYVVRPDGSRWTM